ncbi:hypothetical protein Avbf_13670 [Armadillidium vulgare]|nr:hypothetical protein Avbf_13670 [Armadillidium vulgare]
MVGVVMKHIFKFDTCDGPLREVKKTLHRCFHQKPRSLKFWSEKQDSSSDSRIRFHDVTHPGHRELIPIIKLDYF